MTKKISVEIANSSFSERLAHFLMRPFSAGMTVGGGVRSNYTEQDSDGFLLSHVLIDNKPALDCVDDDDSMDWIFEALEQAEQNVFSSFKNINAAEIIDAKDIDMPEIFAYSTEKTTKISESEFSLGGVENKVFKAKKLTYKQLADKSAAGGLFKTFIGGDVVELSKKIKTLIDSVVYNQDQKEWSCSTNNLVLGDDSLHLACFAKALEVNFSALKKFMKREMQAMSSGG